MWRIRYLVIALGALTSSCFLYYDSRWGQKKESQKRVAAHYMPSALGAQEDGAPARAQQRAEPLQKLRLRAYATRHYATALVDGEAQFRQSLDDANPLLERDLSFRVELVEYRAWSTPSSDDDLTALIEAVAKEDPAADVEWVTVLASPRPIVAESPDVLGRAQFPGQYMAIRAMSDAHEFDVIERGFTELSDSEKAKLYKARKRHKAASVLLHEIGHTLGLPHELAPKSIMNAEYSPNGSAFGAEAVQIARHALTLRNVTPGSLLHRQAAQSALNVLDSAPKALFEPDSRAKVSQMLLQFLPRSAPARSASGTIRLDLPVAPSPTGTTRREALSPADGALLAQARAEQQAGRFEQAWQLAEPLFARYPKQYDVQDLRCQLAMKLKTSYEEARPECEALMQLTAPGWSR